MFTLLHVQMASVEAGQFNTIGADRVLEQALACDFSIRSAPRFRLVKAIIRAQQVCTSFYFLIQAHIVHSLKYENLRSPYF